MSMIKVGGIELQRLPAQVPQQAPQQGIDPSQFTDSELEALAAPRDQVQPQAQAQQIAPQQIAPQQDIQQQAPTQQPMAQQFDPSQFTDAELEVLAGQQPMPQQQAPREQDPSTTMRLAQKGLDLMIRMGNIADVATTSTTARSGLSAIIPEGELFTGEKAGGRGFKPFGSTDETATGREIAVQAGVSDVPMSQRELDVMMPAEAMLTGLWGKKVSDAISTPAPAQTKEELQALQRSGAIVSPAQIAGLGVDIAADPSAFIPIGFVLRKMGMVGKYAVKGTAAAIDAATGMKGASGALDVIGSTAQITKDALKKTFFPKVAKDWKRIKQTAKENNINLADLPETAEFGKEGIIGKLSQTQAEVGQTSRLEQWEKTHQAIKESIDKKVQTISGGKIPFESTTEAGVEMRNAYSRGVKNFFNQIDHTHNSILAQSGDMPLSLKAQKMLDKKLDEIAQTAEFSIERGIKEKKPESRTLLANINQVKANKNSYQALLQNSREMSDVFQGPPRGLGQPISNVEKTKDIYHAIKEALVQTVDDTLGKQIGDSLRKNNQAMTEFFKNAEKVQKTIKNADRIDDAKAFKTIFLSKDKNKIDAMKHVLLKEDFDLLRGSAVNNLLKENLQEKLLYASTANNLKEVDKLLSANEIKGIVDLLYMGDRIGSPILSSSQTSTSLIIRNMLKLIPETATNEVVIRRLKEVARNSAKATDAEMKAIERLRKYPRGKVREIVETLPMNEWGRFNIGTRAEKAMAVQRESLRKDRDLEVQR